MIRFMAIASALAAVFSTLAGFAQAAGTQAPSGATAARAEIQINLCSPPDQIERALNLRARGAPLEVWLFDNDALVLFQRGLRFRLRVAKRGAELTLKVANQDCAHWGHGLAAQGEGKCEYDLHGTEMAGAVSLSRNVDSGSARDLLAGRLPLAQSLSAAQSNYLRQIAPGWSLPNDVRAVGPQRVASYRAKGKPYDVTVSRLPGGETYVEISSKVALADAMPMRDSLEKDLLAANIATCTDQSAQAIEKLRLLQRLH